MSLISFNFNTSTIRFVDGKPVASDVAKTLGYADPKATISKKVSSKNKGVAKIETPGGIQSITVLEEPGIYQLIFNSKLPNAEQFQDWVFEEVLPSIRETGSYSVEHKTPQTYLEALKALVASEEEKLKLEQEKALLEQENEQLATAVDELFNYSSIIRVAKFNNCSEKAFSWRKLKAASIAMGLEIKKVPCPRYETKNLYSHDAWRYVYPQYQLPETTTIVIA